jgi:hypothetical protein
MANRVWKHLMGRGLVEPVDDLRPTNPASHPALLDALAADCVDHGYDLRHLVRTIARSRTYQLTSRPLPGNRTDDRLFSHAALKEMPAQVFLDAVAQVTGVPEHFEGYPEGTRAIELAGVSTPSPALDVLGRCLREASCESDVGRSGGMAQALHLINGPTIGSRLPEAAARLMAAHSSPRELVDELYRRALSRRPLPGEVAGWEKEFTRSPSRSEAVEDLLWTILNSREFAFNH